MTDVNGRTFLYKSLKCVIFVKVHELKPLVDLK